MEQTSDISVKNAAKQEFMPAMRELVRAYQAFATFDATGHRDTDLTVSQADVIFTLGNTQGMTFKEIGEKTLITKGTLTGVIDRLELKGLVKRVFSSDDRRCTRVILTNKGEKMFEQTFPKHVAYLKQRFDRLSSSELKQVEQMLRKIREIFS